MDKYGAEKYIDPRYKIGMRNVKTAISVGACLLFFQFVGFGDGIQASIAAIICMKSSLQNSLQTGIERIIGTIIGAVLGVLSLLLIERITYQISTLLAITGVILIIYLCNIFKVQASTVIGLVVFLIILIGEKDTSPLLYGIGRLAETFFGISVAYLINRFVDPKHLQRFARKKPEISPNIRSMYLNELPQVMAIWLDTNISSHSAINPSYWHRTYDSIRNAYRDTAKIYVYTDENKVLGFIGIMNDMDIIGLGVDKTMKNKDMEKQLLQFCQELFPVLTINVFLNNERLVEILAKSGFYIISESIDQGTKADCYSMAWSNKAGQTKDDSGC